MKMLKTARVQIVASVFLEIGIEPIILCTCLKFSPPSIIIHTGPQAEPGLFFVSSIPTMPKILYDP